MPAPIMSLYRNASLNQKILISAVAAMFIMFSLISALTAWHEHERTFFLENDEIIDNMRQNSPVLSQHLWDFDQASLIATMKGMTLGGTIMAVQVLDQNKVVAEFNRHKEGDNPDRVWTSDLMAPDTGEKIGTLKVTQSYTSIRDKLAYNLATAIAAELLKIVALAALLFIIVHRMLTRHLTTIAHAIELGNAHNTAVPIKIERRYPGKDELDTLIEAINRYRQERLDAEEKLHRDIAERRRVESALQQSEASLSEAMAIARLGYWEYRIADDEFTFNDQYYALHHIDSQHIGGYHMTLRQFATRLLYPDDASAVVTMLSQAISAGAMVSQIETRILCANETVRWVLIHFKNETDSNGTVVKLIGANQDITDRKLAEQQSAMLSRLSAQKEAAEIATQAKSRFLAAASHDLRQPIHALHLFLGTLKNLDLPPEAQRPLENVLRCSESIDAMFVSLLDVAKFDAGMMVPQISDFPIMTVLNRIRHECTQEATDKGLHLAVVPSSAWIKSDPLMVERILRNLVTNAIRYTNTGKILVGCRRRANYQLELQVFDTGVGIALDQQDKIFGEFYKADESDLNQAGLGLGLSIVDQLARLLSAPLRLSSVRGTGSLFSVTFALSHNVNIDNRAVLPPNSKTNLAGCTILLIDDEAIILEATRGLLMQWGCKVLVAQDVQQALQLLMMQPQLPNAILCDFRLRGPENGVTALRMINDEFNAEIPALLITGDTSPQQIVQLQETGIPVLHKPIRGDDLKKALVQLLFP